MIEKRAQTNMNSSDEEPSWIRAFLGIGVSDALRAKLVKAQSTLRESGAHVGWTHPENIHLTLVFLGNIDRDTVDRLPASLDEACRGVASTACGVRGIGFFGGRRPRILWAGVEDDAGTLGILYRRLADAVTELGVEVESRPYTPHITVGRARSSRGGAELTAIAESLRTEPFGELTVDRVTLYKSDLSSTGAVCSILHETVLPDL